MNTSVFVALSALGLLLPAVGDARSLPDNANTAKSKQVAQPLKSYEYIDMTVSGMEGVIGIVGCAASAPIRIGLSPLIAVDSAREGTIAASYGIKEVFTGDRTVTFAKRQPEDLTKTQNSKVQPQADQPAPLKSEQHASECRNYGEKFGKEWFSVAKDVVNVPASAVKMTYGTGGTVFWTAAEVADGSRTLKPSWWNHIVQIGHSGNPQKPDARR